jgi:hypothetical protein
MKLQENVVILLIIGVFVVGVVWWLDGSRISCALSHCDENPVGAPASWPDVMSAAQLAAQKWSADAVLDGVRAVPIAKWARDWSTDKTLQVTFDYLDSSGETLYVSMSDSKPIAATRLGASSQVSQGHYQWLKADAQRRREVLSTIALSPRQAEVLTWDEALAEARNDNTDIAPWFSLELGYGPRDGPTIPTWRVQYAPVPDSPPRPFWDVFKQSSAYVIDATNGDIIERDMDDSLLSRMRVQPVPDDMP